jgi:hypothetical protein
MSNIGFNGLRREQGGDILRVCGVESSVAEFQENAFGGGALVWGKECEQWRG